MRQSRPPLSRPWTGVVAGLAILVAACGQPRDPNTDLVERADRAVTGLERLRPRLAKAGTPDAEILAERLAAVRSGLTTLPTVAPAHPPPAEVENPAGWPVRCPDPGCWRLGAQAEVAAWRVRLRGGGSEIDDVGPAACGLAVGLERARPLDARGEWSWGGELATTIQDRTAGQRLVLVGLRPILRFSIAASETVAFNIRPVLELGQASVRLGAEPDGVLDNAGVYAGFGARLGVRILCAGGELTGEAGWRRSVFQGTAGGLDYRVDVFGPEFAAGWAWRF